MSDTRDARTHQGHTLQRQPRRLLTALAAALSTALVLNGCGNLSSQKEPSGPSQPASYSGVGSGAATAGNDAQGSQAASSTSGKPVVTAKRSKRKAPSAKSLVPPDPIQFEQAVARAGAQLFQDAASELGDEPRRVVIDPLIDANTGAQTASTAKMGKELEAILKRQHPKWSIQPLTRVALAEKPLLLIGTLTPVTVERSIDKQPDAFRIWLTLIDLRTQEVIAKQIDRSTVNSVDATPLPYFQDSPTWHKDKTVAGYINSCQVNTEIGDPADPDYLSHLQAAAVINEAMQAYNERKLKDANRLYKEAETLADDGDLRVLNGLYLTSWQLGQKDAAKQAFGKLVASGLDAQRLPIKLLFKPGSTSFNDVGDLPTQYQMWLSATAQEASKASACLRVVGHTSRTGSASANERLSLRRAEAIIKLLEERDRSLAARLSAGGVGSREALVGLGTDDQRDALDRRVEFRVVDCI